MCQWAKPQQRASVVWECVNGEFFCSINCGSVLVNSTELQRNWNHLWTSLSSIVYSDCLSWTSATEFLKLAQLNLRNVDRFRTRNLKATSNNHNIITLIIQSHKSIIIIIIIIIIHWTTGAKSLKLITVLLKIFTVSRSFGIITDMCCFLIGSV